MRVNVLNPGILARGAGLAALLLLLSAGGLAAQVADPSKVQMTRADLEELLAELERSANSPAYSSAAKARAINEADMVRQRLTEGDFQTGDRVVLRVRGEEALTDTFTVDNDRALPLGLGEPVPLAGVLRSEIAGHLREHLSKYLRDPQVQAESLLRVTVAGQVTSPGFYPVRSTALIDDVLMTAGGPTQTADVTALVIERAGRRIWEGPALEQAIAQGRTLDQMNIRAGDQFQMPQVEQREGIGRTLLFVIPPIISVVVAVAALR